MPFFDNIIMNILISRSYMIFLFTYSKEWVFKPIQHVISFWNIETSLSYYSIGFPCELWCMHTYLTCCHYQSSRILWLYMQRAINLRICIINPITYRKEPLGQSWQCFNFQEMHVHKNISWEIQYIYCLSFLLMCHYTTLKGMDSYARMCNIVFTKLVIECIIHPT